MVVFRSIAIPLTAAVMNLLSAGAAFGIVTAIFQSGWRASVIGVDQTGPIEAFLPVLMFPMVCPGPPGPRGNQVRLGRRRDRRGAGRRSHRARPRRPRNACGNGRCG